MEFQQGKTWSKSFAMKKNILWKKKCFRIPLWKKRKIWRERHEEKNPSEMKA
jgi:hypothetical protein